MTQNYINLSRWIRRAAQCTMLMLTLLICVLTSQAQNLTVTVNGSTTVKNQASLQAAIATSTIATNDITSISVSAGTFTTADWNYLSTIGNLTTFEITNGISSAADVPDNQFTSALIENITLHKVKTIGNSAFYFCSNLSSVNLPNALTISNSAFASCPNLTFIDLPQATDIGNAAFFWCSKLTSIRLPKVTTLNKGAFNGCTVLSNIELPSITNIVTNAFQGCTALTSIYLPKATSIGENAFGGCSSLNILGLSATAPTVGANAFQGCPAERILMLIDENNQPLTGVAQINAASIYKNSSGWSNNQWYGWKLNAPYFITLETTNGTVSLPNSCINLKTNTYAIPDGLNNVDLTLTGNSEHVLRHIDAFETGNASNKVTLTGNENTRSFAMPNHNVTIQTIFSLKYNISATVSPDHSGSISGTGDYFDGESVTLKATPAEGYTFVGWKEGNSTVSSTATYTFTANKNRTLVAEFEINTYTISASANPANGGTVSGGGDYNHGQSVTLKATPAEGYTFVGWKEGNSTVSSSATYTFTANKNRTLVAEFEINTYTISASANPANGGTVSGGGDYNHGQSVTLKASPAEGYTFVGWKEGNSTVSSSATYTFTASKNRTLVAEFEINTYTISASANPANGGTVSGGGDYNHGQSVTLKATPAEGYSFVGWKEGNSSVSPSATYTFTANKNRTLVAEFEINTYTISASANPANGGTVSGGGDYNHGQSVTLKATPAEGYSFVGWKEGNSTVSSTATYTFTANKDRTLVAEFEINTYTISTSANPANGGTVSGGGNYNHGQSVTLKASPAEGYTFVGWKEGNSTVSSSATYTFTASKNRTLVAEFEINTYTISASANPANGGTVSGGGDYNHGQSVTLKASPAEGYTFVGWKEGNSTVSPSATYTFTASKDRTLVAEFEINTYTISASANPANGGTVSGGGDYNHGQSVTLKASPAEGYTFVGWKEGNSTVNSSATYTFTASKDRTLVAEFEINTYTISASANPANGGTVSGGGNYNHGQSVTLKATPAEGYSFVGWKEGNSTVSSSATYTFTASKDRTLVAEFEINTYTISASANPANGGTVSGGGDYNHGQSVTLKATPAEGYSFVGWKEGNSTVNSSATYTFTANKNRTLVAEFEAISVENITLSQTILVATLGDASVQLTATITPSDALNQNIIWSSDNNGVATVNNGLINFVGVGSATITAEIDGISATCNVTVNAATVDVTGIELTPNNLTLTEGDTYTLSATILPNNATNQAINWSSNMPSVATINNGVVTAISEGAATITATTAESGYTATCNITVNPSPRYTITFATTANGTISTTATEFKAGDEVVLTITPADGYQIVAGSLKAHKTGDAGTEVVILANKLTMPHFDVTVTAEFEELTIPSPTSYTITASANPTEGGYVEGAGTYTEGTTISLKARAYAGYKFLKWTDGITAAERNITVTEDANYTAEFEADATIIIYSVTAVAEPTEGGTISGARNYNANDYATLVAKANEGYRFVHWMSNGQELSTNIEYNFEVTQDSTLIAVFEVSPICLPTTHEFDAIACQVYEWNGQPYTTSGNHVQQFTTTTGCDSTVTLHLSIQEPYNGEFTITTSNSYEWNNQTLTSSGDYVQQFTTAAGCDSTITLHLTIIEQSQTGLFDTACEQLSLSPNPTSTGFYIESANTAVRVYSISGQLVLQQSANGKTYVDISRLVAGTYIVRMGNAVAKVIKL